MELAQFILIAAVLLVIAALALGGGMALLRADKQKKIAEEKRTLLEDLPSAGAPAPAAPAAPGQLEILRVLRDPIDGRLTLDIFGSSANSPEALTPGQTDQLKRILVELYKWIGKPASGGADAAPGAAPSTGLAPAPGVGVPPAAPVVHPASRSFAETLPPRPDAASYIPFRKKTPPNLPPAPLPPKSIVAQIDELVQQKLIGTPLAARGIRLVELPDGGMTILDGVRKYFGIDEIEDLDVRALVRSAAQEWNEMNRIKPGAPRP